MKSPLLLLPAALLLLSPALPSPASYAQSAAKPAPKPATNLKELEAGIRAHMGFLASDALGGRGSGTPNERIACEYVAAQWAQSGIEPAGDADASGKKSYLQTITIPERRFAEMPQMRFDGPDGAVAFTHGKEVLIAAQSVPSVEGPLQVISGTAKAKAGAAVLVPSPPDDFQQAMRDASARLAQGARVVLIEETPALRDRWDIQGRQAPRIPVAGGTRSESSIVVLSTDAVRALRQAPEGTLIRIGGKAEDVPRYTYNVVGVLPGSDTQSKQAVLFSAHIDHLGDRPGPGNQTSGSAPADTIYNGADDDASGVVAVLEIARALGRGPAPKRTVYFACFGSEETGGAGARAFLQRPPTPLANLVCNLEFEMIGRPDPKVAANELWLTGYERSNLGPELRKQGANIVADPHPKQNFFFRSDNIQLARRGVVAQTVSSFGLHPQYHRPDDDIAHIDFAHMTRAIASLLSPARYLVNSDFVPAWVEGKRP